MTPFLVFHENLNYCHKKSTSLVNSIIKFQFFIVGYNVFSKCVAATILKKFSNYFIAKKIQFLSFETQIDSLDYLLKSD